MWMVVGEFLFLVTKNLKSRRLDLLSNHEICFQNFSFSSRNWRKLQISRLFFAKILVLFSNQKTDLDISLFSSRNSKYGLHISLSLLDFTFWHLVNAWWSCEQKGTVQNPSGWLLGKISAWGCENRIPQVLSKVKVQQHYLLPKGHSQKNWSG